MRLKSCCSLAKAPLAAYGLRLTAYGPLGWPASAGAARELALTARPFDGREAKALGLVRRAQRATPLLREALRRAAAVWRDQLPDVERLRSAIQSRQNYGYRAGRCLAALREPARLPLWLQVTACFDEEAQMQAAVLRTARAIAAKSPLAVAGTKRSLNYSRRAAGAAAAPFQP